MKKAPHENYLVILFILVVYSYHNICVVSLICDIVFMIKRSVINTEFDIKLLSSSI